jgi:hypothetical protein
MGAAGSLDTATAIGTPAGTVVGAAGPWATAAVAGAPAGTVVGAIGPWATIAIAGTATSAPAWLSFDPSMGGALYWSMSHAFFTAP